jgi:uncharacterized protein (DUF2062 family)
MSLKFMRWLHQQGLSRKRLRGGWLHGWFGEHLFNPHLWRLERDGVARAFFWGSLSALSPFFGLHLIIGCTFAMVFRANIPVTVAVQFLTNPATIIFYYPAAYLLGSRLLGHKGMSAEQFRDLLQRDGFLDIWNTILQIWWPLLLGCSICGLVLGGLGWILVRLLAPAPKKRPVGTRSTVEPPGVR